MAKKKKGKRRRSTKRSKRSGPKAKPMGMAGGVALSGMQILADKDYGGIPLVTRMVNLTKGTDSLTNVVNASKEAVTDLSNYKYALAGILVTGSTKIPIVSMIAKPADRGLKRLTKGKWGL